MKKAVSFLLCAAMLFILSIPAAAQSFAFELTPEYSSGIGPTEYMPEQQIYHFKSEGDLVAEIPVYGGVYVYLTLGGYHSASNGVTDNGINCVCQVHVEFLDENGEQVFEGTAGGFTVPADGTFRRYSLGSDDMYAGLPEEVRTMRIDVHGENNTAYIKNMFLTSSDTAARDMSVNEWEIHDMGNINANTSRADYWIMVAFVFAVAVIMMIFAKARNNIRNKK